MFDESVTTWSRGGDVPVGLGETLSSGWSRKGVSEGDSAEGSTSSGESDESRFFPSLGLEGDLLAVFAAFVFSFARLIKRDQHSR